MTEAGPMPVERLRVGTPTVLARGGSAEIVWIGQRRIDCRWHPRPRDVWPVRVKAGAFGDGAPCRDLRLSPDHAVYLEGALIPVRYLVSGATVVQEAVDRVGYFHIELPDHDVILAEGLPAESYLDTGNRSAFAGGEAFGSFASAAKHSHHSRANPQHPRDLPFRGAVVPGRRRGQESPRCRSCRDHGRCPIPAPVPARVPPAAAARSAPAPGPPG